MPSPLTSCCCQAISYSSAALHSPQQKKTRLDAILTVVDAKHLIQHLDDPRPEVRNQLREHRRRIRSLMSIGCPDLSACFFLSPLLSAPFLPMILLRESRTKLSSNSHSLIVLLSIRPILWMRKSWRGWLKGSKRSIILPQSFPLSNPECQCMR